MADWLDANAIIARIDELVLQLGDDAFAHQGRAHLYSGPSRFVRKHIQGFQDTNHDRARRRADKAKAALIDDTLIGQYLINFDGVGVYEYMEANPLVRPEQKAVEATKVWGHVSRLFILSLWGDVTTTVCGADREGVYYTTEIPTFAAPEQAVLTIPELIQALFARRKDGKEIETINVVPMKKFRLFYTPEHYEDAHRLISLAEQRLDLTGARRDQSLEDFLDFHTGREQYRVDRYEILRDMRPVYGHTKEERAKERSVEVRDFVGSLLEGSRVSLEGLEVPKAPSFRGYSTTRTAHAPNWGRVGIRVKSGHKVGGLPSRARLVISATMPRLARLSILL